MVANSSDSELNYLIAPEIKDDEFYSWIQQLAQRQDIKTVLEIGSSSGGGSTEAFVKGLRQNPNQPVMYCMEVSKPRFESLRDRYASEGFVQCYNVSSVALDQFPSPNEVVAFYEQVESPLRQFPVEQVVGWLRQDIEYVRSSGIWSNGIRQIKTENQIETFDLVLIDGSEFTGDVELEEVYGAKFILLDDICTFKNYKSHQQLLADPNYALIAQNLSLRNGYSIFKRVDSQQVQQSAIDLPIHFFTIVLNGEPFIRYHIEAFKQLPFKWHWHIIEGVAELKHDTAWSLHHGGQVTDELHQNGRSKDGTTAYLDELAAKYPENITVYRKPENVFWDGKREMVNAPLENINEACLLWQVDADELWTMEQICTMRQMFLDRPEKTAAYYWCSYFVGENLVITSRNCYTQNPKQEWLRTWRFQPGMIWAAHEPPQLVKPLSHTKNQDIAAIQPFLHHETEQKGLVFQHFAYVTPEQLRFKEQYYGYQNAVSHWQSLQTQTEFPVLLRDHFSWVVDETLVEPASVCGIAPIAQKYPHAQAWHFLSSSDYKQQAMQVKKPFPQIVIDGVFFQIANSGIARVWKSLLEEWAETDLAKHLVVLDRDGTAPRIPGIRYRPVRRFDYSHTGSDAEMLQEICDEKGADLFISTYYTAPLTTPSVFMAYDMIPEAVGMDLNEIGWREKHYGIMHACRYITISESTARDLLKFFPNIPEWAVTVAHCGIPKGFSPATAEAVEQFKTQHHLTKPYYLMVGDRTGANGYKNGILFFRALNQLPKDKDFAVVCVGGWKEFEPELAALAKDVELHKLHLSDEELKAAYSGAIALVYPSKYEGFGLPIAEALACGCPVITCHSSSIPEVAGEAAIYVSPHRVEEMMQALQDVRKPEIRERLIAKGLEQVQHFSWSKMAEIVKGVLLEAAEKLKQGSLTQVSPIWKEFRKLQAHSQQATIPIQPNPAELQVVQSQVHALQEQVNHVQEQLKLARNQLRKTKEELEQTQGRLGEAEGMVEAMKTSKFWKLRSSWFRFKRKLGLPTNE